MKVLILGGGGQVARAVAAAAPPGCTLLVRSSAELDITDRPAVEREVAAARAAWIVNGAAYTAVDQAEDERERAAGVNDAAVGCIADAAARSGSRLLHLSTDFVFDGAMGRAYRPEDAPNPLSVYGATKLGGERRALAAGCAAIVLRTSWVYAAAGRNFVLTMLRLMRERDQLRVVGDQIGAPTHAAGLARAIWGLIGAGVPAGIHHWTDLGVASWYDFAVAIQEEALTRGLISRGVPIAPIATHDYPTKAVRPRFSVLDTGATRAAAAAPANHWRHNLRLMLDELRTA